MKAEDKTELNNRRVASGDEPSTESEDQERFEETAKFEEEIDTPKVETKSEQKQTRKSKIKRKSPTRSVNEDKPVSKLHDELRKHSDARKKAEREILDIKKELKNMLLVHHATIKDLQKQVAQMHRKIATIDSSRKSAKVKTTARKTSTRNKKTSSIGSQKRKVVKGRVGNVSCSLNELVSVIQKKQHNIRGLL